MASGVDERRTTPNPGEKAPWQAEPAGVGRRLLRNATPTACVMTGHGEPALLDTSPTGLSNVSTLLTPCDTVNRSETW